MRRWCRLAGTSLVLWLSSHAPSAAQSTDPPPVLYALENRSTYETGCFGGPCDCGILQHSMRGTLRLRHTGFDGLFDNYEVLDVKLVVALEDGNLDISGAGKYRVGGEFAIMHQLTLDLMEGNEPKRHFDSGLVPGGREFPVLNAVVSLHGMTECTDTVLHVVADPVVAAIGDPGAYGLTRVTPNPFQERTELELILRGAGPVYATVYDAQGRAVRKLVRGEMFEAGRHLLDWDGLIDRGGPAPPGLYFVRVRADHREFGHAMVKVH